MTANFYRERLKSPTSLSTEAINSIATASIAIDLPELIAAIKDQANLTAETLGYIPAGDDLHNDPTIGRAAPGTAAHDAEVEDLAERLWLADPRHQSPAREFGDEYEAIQDSYRDFAQRLLDPDSMDID